MSGKKKQSNKLVGLLKQKQNKIKTKFGLDCATKYHINNKGKLYAYDKYNVIMEADIQIIGTINDKNCYWRWAWANPSINCKFADLARKMIEYGEDKKNAKFYTAKVKGKTNAMMFTATGSYLDKKVQGYHIFKKPNTNTLVYLVLYNCKKSSYTLNKLLNMINEKKI